MIPTFEDITSIIYASVLSKHSDCPYSTIAHYVLLSPSR